MTRDTIHTSHEFTASDFSGHDPRSRPSDSPLLRRVKALRQVVPGLKLAEAKSIVESDADEALMRAFDLVVEQHRSSVRAERRERIATTVYASMFTATKLRPTVQERGTWAAEAVAAADALMAELDRRRAADRS